MHSPSRNSRERILEAAGALAREVGPGNISLEAVAQKAGLSKGGLLYNFPSKAKLMEALVEMHVEENRRSLSKEAMRLEGGPNALARAMLSVFLEECGTSEPPASGVLAAIAENPNFVQPIRQYQRELVERVRRESDDRELATIVLLMIEGLRCMKLFEIDALGPDEIERVVMRAGRLLGDQVQV